MEKFDLARMLAIWRWLLDPAMHPQPRSITKEELVATYCRNVTLLQKFRKTLEKANQDIAAMNIRRITGR